MRGYGAQLWLSVQDLSQLKAVYPRWQSFLANSSQQYFGIADYDTAHYISNALGHYTIAFETANRSRHTGQAFKPGTSTAGSGEHLTGRALLTPDEIMRLGPVRPIVMISGEPLTCSIASTTEQTPPAPAAPTPTRCTSPPPRSDRPFTCRSGSRLGAERQQARQSASFGLGSEISGGRPRCAALATYITSLDIKLACLTRRCAAFWTLTAGAIGW